MISNRELQISNYKFSPGYKIVLRNSKIINSSGSVRSFVLASLCLISFFCYSQKWDTIPNLPDLYKQRVELFKKEPVVEGKILFLGNSITQGGNWKTLLNDSTVINRGIGGDITFGILNRLDDVTKRKPSKVFLLIGINDISKNIPDEVIMENIFSIVNKIKGGLPKTEIYVQSILPLNPGFEKFPPNYDKQAHVITLNKELKKYADRLKYTFVDLYPEFLNKDNLLEAKYSTDGLHLNAAGYSHWVSVLRSLKYVN
jgi:lysophospholipase L1-like esterase